MLKQERIWVLQICKALYSRCHQPRDSLFSWSSKFNNWTGLVNWGFLLLTMGGFRLLLENFIKYGIRIDPMQWFVVITGKDGAEPGFPSLILLTCKELLSWILSDFNWLCKTIFFRRFCPSASLFPGWKGAVRWNTLWGRRNGRSHYQHRCARLNPNGCDSRARPSFQSE